jgi:hypothetical protein
MTIAALEGPTGTAETPETLADISALPLTIAGRVIAKCGGAQAVADMVGRHVTTIYKWTWSQDKGGTGGYVPAKLQVRLIAAARARGIDLSHADFAPIQDGVS